MEQLEGQHFFFREHSINISKWWEGVGGSKKAFFQWSENYRICSIASKQNMYAYQLQELRWNRQDLLDFGCCLCPFLSWPAHDRLSQYLPFLLQFFPLSLLPRPLIFEIYYYLTPQPRIFGIYYCLTWFHPHLFLQKLHRWSPLRLIWPEKNVLCK